VNEALASLLKGSNTTISIAHRLSTIKRSDTIICLGSDGRVAEMGSYRELSSRPEGAFTKLMEWQMGGEARGDEVNKEMGIAASGHGPPSESEEIEHLLRSGESESDLEVEPEEETQPTDKAEVVVPTGGSKT
jgi:putative ABC transport system ATP-binding protein